MAAAKKKKSSPLDASGVLLRGPALVAEVIGHVQSGASDLDIDTPCPLEPARLAALTFVGGAPLPPSLRTWLAFDALWWMQHQHHFHDLAAPRLQPISLAALSMRVKGTAEYASAFCALASTPFAAPVVRLGDDTKGNGEEVQLALCLGGTDEAGEYPVLAIDDPDAPRVALRYAGLDLWLADVAGLLGKEAKLAGKLLPALAARFGGAVRTEMIGAWTGFDAKKKEVWASETVTLDAGYTDDEPADLATGEPPRPALAKPVPKLSEERLTKQLIKAIHAHEGAVAEWLLAAAVERYPAGAWRDLALGSAAHHGPPSLVRKLVAAGATVNPPGDPPLVAAARPFEHDEAAIIAEILLDAGADVNGETVDGEAAMDQALDNGLPRVVALLLARGARVDRTDEHGHTLLHRAAQCDQEPTGDCVRLLARAGVPLDALDEFGQPALISAVYGAGDKRRASALALVEAGADVNLPAAGDSAFTVAWSEQQREVVAAMRPRADLERRTTAGWSVAELAGDDVWLPRVLSVSYEPSAAPQTLAIEVEARALAAAPEKGKRVAFALDAELRAFARRASKGKVAVDVTSAQPELAAVPVHRLSLRLRVVNLELDALLSGLCEWRTLRQQFITSLEVRGENAAPIDGAHLRATWLAPPRKRPLFG